MTHDNNALYSKEFYRSQIGGSVASAREVVPLVLGLVPARSVCDIGCGAGTWLSVFRDAGLDVHGFDGPWVSPESLMIPNENFTTRNLASPPLDTAKFDLSMSLEVAEHLPEASAEQFVDTLTQFAPVVLFSAAIPHQGGTGHINEQWPNYWIEKFAARGFRAIDCLRPVIWGNANIEYWYRQNIFLFASVAGLEKYPKLKVASERVIPMPISVVHPSAFVGSREPDSFLKTAKMLPKLFVRAVKRKMKFAADQKG